MAPKTIIIIEHAGKGLEEFHDLAERTLQEYYDRSPTSLIDIPMSEKELGDISYYNALAEAAIKSEKDGHW